MSAAAGAALAVVARERGDERVAVAGDVVVAELVDAAHAVIDDGGAGRVLGGHIGHHIGGNVAGGGGPLQGVGLHVLPQARELGEVALAVNGELAFQGGRDTLGLLGHRRVRVLVPHVEGLQLHRLAGLGVGARRHVHQARTRFRIDEERQRRVGEHVLAIEQVLVQDVLRHAEEERRVGAGPQVHPLVGLARRGAEARVQADELRARLLRVQHTARPGEARLHQVRVGQNDHGSLGPLPYGVLREHADPGREGHDLPVALAHVVAVHAAGLGPQHAGQKRWEALRGLGGELDPQGILAVLVLDGLEVLGDHLEGLLPADGLELAASPLAHALHGALNTRLAVDVLHLGKALQAHVLETMVLIGARLDHREPPVTHSALQHAIAQAMLVVIGKGLGLARRSRGRRASCLGDARQVRAREADRAGSGSGFQEAAAAEHAAPRFLLHGVLLLFSYPSSIARAFPKASGDSWVQSTKRQQGNHCPFERERGLYPIFGNVGINEIAETALYPLRYEQREEAGPRGGDDGR